MLELPIRSVLEPRKLVVAPPEASVDDAARLMKEAHVGAVLIVEQGRLIGIFTERDAVYRVLAARRDPLLTRLAEVMTRDPVAVSPDETFGYALLLMHDNGFRHAPVVENGRPIGVVSTRHALDPELEEFTAETQRRKSIRRLA
ncbi:MAG TPA: CBS domain-containing protein [Burkholderiales bacterium]|jgi:CBS domain-containing protein|nr:CBS domain-containing protein [Burkholderiales bacterium]